MRPLILAPCLCMLLFCLSPSYSQVEGLRVDSTWRSGSVLLNNNAIRKGYLQYDSYSSLVAFKENMGDESDSYEKSKILAMEFFDSERAVMRRFARLEYKEGEDLHTTLLCEFVMEMKSFYVLSSQFLQPEGILLQARTLTGLPHGAPTTLYRGHSLNERIFFMDKSTEKLEQVLVVPPTVYLKKNRSYGGMGGGPLLDEVVLEKYLHAHWNEVKVYRKANKLKFRKHIDQDEHVRDEFFQVLGYYKRLEDGKW